MAILFDLVRQRAALLSLAVLASIGVAVLALAPLLAIYALEFMAETPDHDAIRAEIGRHGLSAKKGAGPR